MTPKHLTIFCLAQLMSIAGGTLLARKCIRIFEEFAADGADGIRFKIPAFVEFLKSSGWWLIAIPIACVLLIPRHREDEDGSSLEWRWYSSVAALVGGFAVVLPLLGGIRALFFMLSPSQ